MEVWRDGPPGPFDYVDGGCAGPVNASGLDPRQLNGPYLSLAAVVMEDPQHPLPNVGGDKLYYVDDKAQPLETGLEEQAGAYGNIGSEFLDINSTREADCNTVRFGGASQVFQIKLSDSGNGRSLALDDNEKLFPFQVTGLYQTPGGGQPKYPCQRTLDTVNPGTGFNTDSAVLVPCGNDGLWFELHRAVDSGPFERIADLRTQTQFKDYDVQRNTTYRYYAVTYNAAGQKSTPSPTVAVTVTDTTPPNPPTISAGSSGGSGTLSWDWTDEFDLFGYHVYRSTSPGGPYTKLTVAGPVRRTSFSVQLIPPGRTYYFIVKTVDQGGLESGPSNEVALTGQ